MGARLHFEGSHGALTACAVSGAVIEATACDCEDCATFGDYRSIALVDVHGTPRDVIEAGGGDILSAALIYRDGGYCTAMAWAGEEGGYWVDAPPMLPAPGRGASR